jgi:hypothetical protein
MDGSFGLDTVEGLPYRRAMGVERKDVHAAVEARRELGPAYDEQIVESLLAKLDTLEAKPAPPAKRQGSITILLLGMMGCGVGATAIAVTHEAAWLAAIIWVAIAYAAGEIARYR